MTFKRSLKFCFVLYVVVLHVLLVFVLSNPSVLEKLDSSARRFFTDITSHYRQMVKYHRRLDASVAPGSTLLIGDSLFQALPTSRLNAPVVNYGIGQDTTLGVIKRLPVYKSMATAKTIVLLIGINDLFKRNVSDTLSNYRRLLELLPDCKQVLVVSLLPIDSKNLHARLDNTKVNRFNEQLQTLISQRPNTLALNVSEQLENGQGELDHRFHVGDGLHINQHGYDVLIAALNAHFAAEQAPLDCENQQGDSG